MQNNEDRNVSPWQDGANQVVDVVNKVVHEGTVRRVLVERDGQVLAQFPLLFGVVGAALAPAVAVLGGIAAIATHCKVRVERADEVQPFE